MEINDSKISADEHDSLLMNKDLKRKPLFQAMLYAACFLILIFFALTIDLNEIKAEFVSTDPLLFCKTQVMKVIRAGIFERKADNKIHNIISFISEKVTTAIFRLISLCYVFC